MSGVVVFVSFLKIRAPSCKLSAGEAAPSAPRRPVAAIFFTPSSKLFGATVSGATESV